MEYMKPNMWIVIFEAEDVITTSGQLTDTQTDPDEGFDF